MRKLLNYSVNLLDGIAPEGWQGENGFHLGKEPQTNMNTIELKRRFRELDEQHEQLKEIHVGWKGVEPEPLQEVRRAKERVAMEIWNVDNGKK